ncbi:MAG: hypothetical protein QM611_05010 [Microbacterium sp.]|uniref:hypothetical protein n=1 Tax=Microbacterium sp. TaxID=51671 RepID=UPI0039E59E45
MLTPLNPPEHPIRRMTAYRVPWVVERVLDTHPVVVNAGDRTLDFVRVFVHTRASPPVTESRGQMLSGETAELCLCSADPDDVVVTIAWFRPDDGKEYVWRFVL